MKYIPYFEEELKVSLDEPSLGKRIKESKLEGRYAKGFLKLQRKFWLSNPFRPVAICHYLAMETNGQGVRVIVRPGAVGLGFMFFWFGSLISGMVDALFSGVFAALPFFIGLILAGYALLMVSFWLEVPMLKRELNKLFVLGS
ncbi:hypothetical protein [Photobacterium chitinilyticum]|uniref:Uncharacterized protein n=1 Tax=Photobacterium chitinilyticum TaxID=2485123 RepID=A0A3S3QPQ6_9GAMM|nr:hypothetical protein [Photobacterium chitinilyticum]RWX52683.1 hypothetical protein EDI28_26110 [Photobacterium chitinilyticum]